MTATRRLSSSIAMMVFSVLFAMLLLLARAPAVRADTLYVCPSGCTYTSINDALDHSNPGDTVSVAAGEYREHIWMRGGVRIQGAGADKTTIINSDGWPTVLGYPQEVSDAVLDGFTIICDSPNSAIHFDYTHEKETVSNCVIKNSTGQWHSGGIYIAFGATPKIIDNIFIGNVLTDGLGGGAIFVDNAAPLISGNTFIGNSAHNGAAIAVYNGITYTATIENNTFISNTATARGGAIHVERSVATIRGNHIYSNTAASGAGLAIDTGSNAVVEFNEIAFNLASGPASVGGGIAIANGSNALLNGNVVRQNTSTIGGGIHILNSAPRLTNNLVGENAQADIVVRDGSPHIANNVLFGAGKPGVVGIDLYGASYPVLANNIISSEAVGIRGDGTAVPTIRYNDFWLNSTASYSGVFAESSNLSVNPALRDLAKNDCHLLAGSPMIDAGNQADAPLLDIDGDSRPIDGNGDSVSRVDIGLDEYTVTAPTPTPTQTPIPPGTLVTVTLQYGLNGYLGAEDTYLDNFAAATNLCSADKLKVGWRFSYQPIFRFDLSPIPVDATITRAVLDVYLPSWSGTEITIGAFYITRTVSLCEANWNQASSGHVWGTAGALNTLTDRRPAPEATISTSGPRKWYSFDLTTVTQGWRSGALTNNGVILRGSYENTGYFYIDSAQSVNYGQRPKLVVSFRTGGVTPATPTPTPTTRTPTPTGTAVGIPTATPTPTQSQVGDETTVVYQQGVNGYSGALDTYIFLYSPDTNYCSGEPLKVGYRQQYGSIVQFDLSAIPPAASVTHAELQLYATGWGGTDISMGAYYITPTVRLCETTWIRARADQTWGQAGASSTLTDRRAAPESTLTTHGARLWYALDLTSITQGWVNGSLANNGVLLRAAYSVGSFYFASAHNGTESLRPKLIVTYRTTSGPTSTPTATPTSTPIGMPTHTPTPTPTATPSPPPGTGPTTVTFQQGVNGYAGSGDTRIDQYYPSVSYCAEESFKIGYRQRYAAFVRFDLTAIPTGSTIESATLKVYATAWSGADITAGAFVVLRNTVMCEVTWNQAASGNPWGAAGANDTTTDRRSYAASTVTTNGPRQYYSFNLTGAVQQWVSGSLPNNGVMLRSPSSTSTNSFQFASVENQTVSLRPQLIVTYHP